jgi:glycosyltransferase involved in cell wall biosynthesis
MKVSIVVITYNHAPFVTRALDSILAQNVRGEYEIIISEDCSTDGTRQIVVDFHEEHPDISRLLLSERNLNSNQVVARAIRAARGEYIAMLDGDDYWLSSEKLHKQVEFLDAHPECAVCFHNAVMFHEDGARESRLYVRGRTAGTLDLEELLRSSFPSCSTMYRNGLVAALPEWFDTLPMSDGPLHVLHAEHGRVGYLDEVLGAYRVHAGGVWSSLSRTRKLEAHVRMYETLDSHTRFRYRTLLGSMIAERCYRLAVEHARAGALVAARRCARRCIREGPFNTRLSARESALAMLLACSPRAYRMIASRRQGRRG